MKRLFLMLLAVTTLVACDTSGEDTPPKSITFPNQQQLTQTVYADDNSGKSNVTFTTTGAWTSEIKETAAAKSSRTAADWISISPSGGDKAGDYTIGISLLTNYTGEKRSATISLKCSGEMVAIAVTQEAVTAAGETPKPDPEPSGEGILKNETTGKSVRLVALKHGIEAPERVRIIFTGETIKAEGGEKEQPGFEYMADFYNPLQSGRLKPGTYNVKYGECVNGECLWFKSDLANYGESGTIKVELNNEIYTFTFDFKTGEDKSGNYKLTGSFTGVPEYFNKQVKVAGITLSETQKTLECGGSFTLNATILPENATDKRYTWSSDNPSVATVSENGLVQAVSAGTATIKATSAEGEKTATCAVKVNSPVAVTGIKVEPTEVTLLEGEYLEFYNVKVLPENAFNKNYAWKSSDETVAVYTGKGIEAKAPGVATITFTTEEGAKKATLKVTVEERASLGSGTIKTVTKSGQLVSNHSIYNINRTIVSKDEVRLDFMDRKNQRVSELTFYNLIENGGLKPGTYSIMDHIGNITGDDRYGYVKSAMWGRPAETGGTYMYFYKTGSVVVTKSGDDYTIRFDNVKTNSTVGFDSEDVTCSFSGKFTPMNEYVSVSSVTINQTVLPLTIGGGYQLNATVNPTNAFNKSVKWSTSNSSVASVSDNGYVYTSGVGTATIKVTTEDGAKTATCQVTVSAHPSTGNGTFSNQSQSLSVNRAEQWVNEKEPKEIDVRFAKPNSSYGNLSFTLVRTAGDTRTLKAGTYNSIKNLMCDEFGIKYSNENTGSATVTLSGDNYTVTLDVTSSEGTKITGTYTGKIPAI